MERKDSKRTCNGATHYENPGETWKFTTNNFASDDREWTNLERTPADFWCRTLWRLVNTHLRVTSTFEMNLSVGVELVSGFQVTQNILSRPPAGAVLTWVPRAVGGRHQHPGVADFCRGFSGETCSSVQVRFAYLVAFEWFWLICFVQCDKNALLIIKIWWGLHLGAWTTRQGNRTEGINFQEILLISSDHWNLFSLIISLRLACLTVCLP